MDRKKLKEVFKLAGRILKVEIFSDKERKSIGYGVVEYSHPIEAVQAICILIYIIKCFSFIMVQIQIFLNYLSSAMFNNQFLFERPMSIHLDRTNRDPLARHPDGLRSIGLGLGATGTPFHVDEGM